MSLMDWLIDGMPLSGIYISGYTCSVFTARYKLKLIKMVWRGGSQDNNLMLVKVKKKNQSLSVSNYWSQIELIARKKKQKNFF